MNTELKIAESVQKSMIASQSIESAYAEIQFHFEAANRLGGDWFYVIVSSLSVASLERRIECC